MYVILYRRGPVVKKTSSTGTTVSCRPRGIGTGPSISAPGPISSSRDQPGRAEVELLWRCGRLASPRQVHAPGQVLSSKRGRFLLGTSIIGFLGHLSLTPRAEPHDTSTQSESKCLYLTDRLLCLNSR